MDNMGWGPYTPQAAPVARTPQELAELFTAVMAIRAGAPLEKGMPGYDVLAPHQGSTRDMMQALGLWTPVARNDNGRGMWQARSALKPYVDPDSFWSKALFEAQNPGQGGYSDADIKQRAAEILAGGGTWADIAQEASERGLTMEGLGSVFGYQPTASREFLTSQGIDPARYWEPTGTRAPVGQAKLPPPPPPPPAVTYFSPPAPTPAPQLNGPGQGGSHPIEARSILPGQPNYGNVGPARRPPAPAAPGYGASTIFPR